jgi:hypothetical protein
LVAVADADAETFGTKPWWESVADTPSPVDLKIEVPHSARMYDYALGGKDNFPADRAAAEQALTIFPDGPTAARQNRAFLHRAIRYLAGGVGIRQFLDIGTGIPTSPNLHEVAQDVAPDARVVYADNDPIVLAHARALLTGSAEGRTAYLDADIRDPDHILAAPELRDTLDLTRPVALSLIAISHFIPDDNDPYGIVRRLMDPLPSGSFLALTHFTADFAPEQMALLADVYGRQAVPLVPRSRGEVTRFFDGLDLVEPGVQAVHRWRPDGTAPGELTDAQVSAYGGIAIKS